MMVGMIPKDSLLAFVFFLLLLISNANLITGFLSAVFFSWLSPILDPLSHNVGVTVLTYEGLQPWFCQLDALPLAAWARIENTVVTGSFIIGILLMLPLYFVSYRVMARYRDALVGWVVNNRVTKWIIGPPTPELQES